MLLVLMPLLNILTLKTAQLKNIVILGGIFLNLNPFFRADSILGNGNSLYVYLLGAYLRNLVIWQKKMRWMSILIISISFQFLLVFYHIHLPLKISLTSDTALLPFFSSVALFMLLKDIKRKTKAFSTRLLKRLSVSAVFVYII